MRKTDFSLVLATITASLSDYLGTNPNVEFQDTDVRGCGDDVAEGAEDEEEEEPVPNAVEPAWPAETRSSAAAAATAKKASKAAVLDSWEDGDDDDDKRGVEEEPEPGTAGGTGEGGYDYRGFGGEVEPGKGTLRDVLKAFQLLREEFDGKFRAIFA